MNLANKINSHSWMFLWSLVIICSQRRYIKNTDTSKKALAMLILLENVLPDIQ